MQSGWIEIIFLAMLAGFIGLRLYHVLGRRTERGEDTPAEAPVADAFRPAPLPRSAARRPAEDAPARLDVPADASAEVRDGLEQIARADQGFSVERFLIGPRGAYELVLEGFWKGDRQQLAELLSDEMLADFKAALETRALAGERVENRLIAIDRADIVAASMNGTMAEITVRFDAEIVAVTRDAEGRVISGDPQRSVETHDLWTFSRHSSSPDPAWIIVATDEEA